MTTPREMPKDYAGFKAWIEDTFPEIEMPAFCENLRAATNAQDVVHGRRIRRIAQLKTRIVTLDDASFVAAPLRKRSLTTESVSTKQQIRLTLRASAESVGHERTI